MSATKYLLDNNGFELSNPESLDQNLTLLEKLLPDLDCMLKVLYCIQDSAKSLETKQYETMHANSSSQRDELYDELMSGVIFAEGGHRVLFILRCLYQGLGRYDKRRLVPFLTRLPDSAQKVLACRLREYRVLNEVEEWIKSNLFSKTIMFLFRCSQTTLSKGFLTGIVSDGGKWDQSGQAVYYSLNDKTSHLGFSEIFADRELTERIIHQLVDAKKIRRSDVIPEAFELSNQSEFLKVSVSSNLLINELVRMVSRCFPKHPFFTARYVSVCASYHPILMNLISRGDFQHFRCTETATNMLWICRYLAPREKAILLKLATTLKTIEFDEASLLLQIRERRLAYYETLKELPELRVEDSMAAAVVGEIILDSVEDFLCVRRDLDNASALIARYDVISDNSTEFGACVLQRSRILKAQIFRYRGHFERAREILESLVDCEDNATQFYRSTILSTLSNVYCEMGRVSEALDVLRIWDMGGELVHPRDNSFDRLQIESACAEALLESGSTDKALRMVDEMLLKRTDTKTVLKLRILAARASHTEKQWGMARENWENVLKAAKACELDREYLQMIVLYSVSFIESVTEQRRGPLDEAEAMFQCVGNQYWYTGLTIFLQNIRRQLEHGIRQ